MVTCETAASFGREPSDAALADIVQILSARNQGLVLGTALNENGVNSHEIERMIQRGQLVRIRRGAYVGASGWEQARPELRYRMFVRACVALTERPTVLSHLSAAVIHGLPIVGPWPTTVHTHEPDAAGGNSSRYVTSHRGGLVAEPVRVDGMLATSLARTVIDVAAHSSFLTGVGVADQALRREAERAEQERQRGVRGLPTLTKDGLREELARVNPRVGVRKVERVINFANSGAANVGESLSRVRIFELGFEVPEVQVHFRGGDGRDYWVDFFWRGVRKIGEFDGWHKYTRGIILGDRDPAEVVRAEKKREDTLRKQVSSFWRWDWNEALSPRTFARLLAEHEVPRG
ncbi:type IV toxin-antitoxin system AbiEi family antitoxin domain-containing protein [Glaciibacter psychrotolerans]|uniref:Type IV toxin-antitoxin system AbiEi family antitoxin domain-containing protein n=1 Tax=Glaciibacter psychrotolerans TaxID=670054 RepID=A0A7Z0EFE6_9MICO|nr:type IV toxin-antitoxin system AbiEi family antitoxin domain-containing protein [Leifsonia psychrotolerans]NYJ20619.1 hypothetical protein [Leifsonia psychrotolerans]